MGDRFTYLKYYELSQIKQRLFKRLFEEIDFQIENNLPEGRARSLCLTALEESYMWIGKAIRDEQVSRHSDAPKEHEERGE